MRQRCSVVVAWASNFVHHVHCFLSWPVLKDVYAIICLKKKKKRTKWCKSHSSGSPKRSLLRAVFHPLKDVKHIEGTIHNSHFSRCGHIVQSSASPEKVFSVRPQSVSQPLFGGGFFSFHSHNCHLSPQKTLHVPESHLCSVTPPTVAGVNSLGVLHVEAGLRVALVERQPLVIDPPPVGKTVVQGYSQSVSRRVQRRTVAQ